VKIYKFIESVINILTTILRWIGYVVLTLMTLVMFSDVCGRYLLNKPITGDLEMSELLMVILAASAIVYTCSQRGHISVDVISTRLSKRTQIVLKRIGSALGFVTWGSIAYYTFLIGLEDIGNHLTTMLLKVPVAPFKFLLSICLFVYAITELLQIFHPDPLELNAEQEVIDI
jgi:TRAP-type transport system small permease protein